MILDAHLLLLLVLSRRTWPKDSGVQEFETIRRIVPHSWTPEMAFTGEIFPAPNNLKR